MVYGSGCQVWSSSLLSVAAPGTWLGMVGDVCWEWDAQPVGIRLPFALQYVRIKSLNPAAL